MPSIVCITYITGITILVSIMYIIIIFSDLFMITIVRSNSMSPTLESGDKVLIMRRWYRRLLKKGRIILVHPFEIQNNENNVTDRGLYVKRLVALPGEHYELIDNFNRRSTWLIPDDHVFVLGDFSASYDSRYWGPVPIRNVVGVVIAVFPR
jgi:signal peptidase I